MPRENSGKRMRKQDKERIPLTQAFEYINYLNAHANR